MGQVHSVLLLISLGTKLKVDVLPKQLIDSELSTSKEVGFLIHRGDSPNITKLGGDHLSNRLRIGTPHAYPLRRTTLAAFTSLSNKPTTRATVNPDV